MPGASMTLSGAMTRAAAQKLDDVAVLQPEIAVEPDDVLELRQQLRQPWSHRLRSLHRLDHRHDLGRDQRIVERDDLDAVILHPGARIVVAAEIDQDELGVGVRVAGGVERQHQPARQKDIALVGREDDGGGKRLVSHGSLGAEDLAPIWPS